MKIAPTLNFLTKALPPEHWYLFCLHVQKNIPRSQIKVLLAIPLQNPRKTQRPSYDFAKHWRQSFNGLQPLIFFAKKLHHRCLTGYSIRLWNIDRKDKRKLTFICWISLVLHQKKIIQKSINKNLYYTPYALTLTTAKPSA